MSPQLTFSATVSVLALALLCVTTGARDLAGGGRVPAPAPLTVQAELAPGLVTG